MFASSDLSSFDGGVQGPSPAHVPLAAGRPPEASRPCDATASSSEAGLEERRRADAERPAALPSPASAEARKSTDEVVLQSLTVLIREHGAQGFTNWDKTADGQLVSTHLVGKSSADIDEKCRLLAAESLQQKRVCFKILSSKAQMLLVAAPVPGIEGYAVTVQFPFSRETDDADKQGRRASIHLRCRDVAVTAAHLGVVRLQGKIAELETKVEEEPESEATWSALLRQVRRLAIAQCNQLASKPAKLALICSAVILIGLIPIPHSVSCKVQCEPSMRRYVAAPFDGKLLKSKAMSGDQVVQGQVLAVLDGGDLRSELASLEAELGQASQRRAAALSTGDASNAELERLEIEKLRGEIHVLATRQNNLEIRAPIGGVVVSGNLERRQGAPVAVGDNLFEIAPLSDLVAEIAIPEAEISRVKQGMKARVTLDAGRGGSHSTVLTQVHPRSEMRDGDSVFLAEAALENQGQEIRPGMLGKARVSIGLRPIGWILFHRPYEVLRGWIGW